MDYEKKYKDALEKAKEVYNRKDATDGGKLILESMFPELKESEDERIRKDIIETIKIEAKEFSSSIIASKAELWLAWLEKQCVQKPIISNNALREGIAHFGITQYQIDNWLKKYVDVEKQGEHKETLCDKCKREQPSHSCQDITELGRCAVEHERKSADKVEPKFNVGDWVVSEYGNVYTVNQVIKVKQIADEYFGYTLDDKTYFDGSLESSYRLWTIQDAKDGDVLVAEIEEYPNDFIYIFKEYNKNLGFWSHCYLDAYTNKFHEGIYHNNLNVGVPATKEQRDMFFQKMHKAGYEWDFEVKELNKIEKKPACSEEEKQLLFKDLCARLPYKVRCKCVSGLGGGETEKGVLKYVGNCYGVISNYYEGVPLHSGFVNNVFYPIENIKPYLRPLASMTMEEFQGLRSMCPHANFNQTNNPEWVVGISGSDYGRISRVDEISKFIDWLNAHHFDFRGLIEKGLALEAHEGMYNS